LPALADDSGLCVDALNGEPGIYSARWAGPDKDFSRAMRNVEEKLQAAGARQPAQRGAHFIAALSLAWPDGLTEVFEGRVDGTLVWPPRGIKGFGYDPMFVPEGHTLTFGEIEPATKHGMSHRARAFAKLMAARLG
jgi:XTP/dITP diphosphohydrolase